MDTYAQQLRSERRWNRIRIVAVVALLPVVVLAAFIAHASSDIPALPYLLVLIWLFALLDVAYRTRSLRCPRCQKTFAVAGWWSPMRGRKCVHCALELDAQA